MARKRTQCPNSEASVGHYSIDGCSTSLGTSDCLVFFFLMSGLNLVYLHVVRRGQRGRCRVATLDTSTAATGRRVAHSSCAAVNTAREIGCPSLCLNVAHSLRNWKLNGPEASQLWWRWPSLALFKFRHLEEFSFFFFGSNVEGVILTSEAVESSLMWPA